MYLSKKFCIIASARQRRHCEPKKDQAVEIFMTGYTATTENITIHVRPAYLDHESDVMERKFVFAYFVRIENHGTEDVQLLRRHWFINHAGGRVEEVEGEGVVGKQPVIPPGKTHEYNSFCILDSFE